MKISPCNSIAFTSTPIYDVKLRKPLPDGTFKEIPATFSKLENDNNDDIEAIINVCASWPNAPFGLAAGSDFLSSKECDEPGSFDYYVIEGKDKTGKRKIYSIAEFNRRDKVIEFCQSNPRNKRNNIKGSGELMLYGIAKYNKEEDTYETFTLSSSEGAMGFYRKMNLSNFYYSFALPTDKTDNFLDRIEKKYHLDVAA